MATERLPHHHRGSLHAQRAGTGAGPSSLPIEDIYPLFPGEWVAVKVTALDKRQRISHGEVLAHSTSLKRVSRAVLRAHRDDPLIHTYLFFGGALPATVDEWRERLAEAAATIKDYKDYLYAGR